MPFIAAQPWREYLRCEVTSSKITRAPRRRATSVISRNVAAGQASGPNIAAARREPTASSRASAASAPCAESSVTVSARTACGTPSVSPRAG